jgi:hypothetical protein
MPIHTEHSGIDHYQPVQTGGLAAHYLIHATHRNKPRDDWRSQPPQRYVLKTIQKAGTTKLSGHCDIELMAVHAPGRT